MDVRASAGAELRALIAQTPMDARAAAAPGADMAAVGEGFEAILVRRIVTALRATIPKADGRPHVTGEQLYDHMIEQALSEHIAASGGIGLRPLFEGMVNGTDDAAADPVPAAPRALAAYRSHAAPADAVPAADRPLSEQLPPQDDPWLHLPDAAQRLQELLSGRPTSEK